MINCAECYKEEKSQAEKAIQVDTGGQRYYDGFKKNCISKKANNRDIQTDGGSQKYSYISKTATLNFISYLL